MAMQNPADELEAKLRQELADLHREYQERAQPIIDKLVELENLKPRPPVLIPRSALDDGYGGSLKDMLTTGRSVTKISAEGQRERVPHSIYFKPDIPQICVDALFQADDALSALRRGHGVEVQGLCYPARNTVDEACQHLRQLGFEPTA